MKKEAQAKVKKEMKNKQNGKGGAQNKNPNNGTSLADEWSLN